MSLLFQSVIWPAVAGNVAWAFFTVLLQEWTAQKPMFYGPRLGLLGALTIYLCLDWTYTESIKSKLRKGYWIGDLFLAIAIAALAIAAQARVGDGRWFLFAVFVASAASQLCGAWTPTDKPMYYDGAWKARFAWFVLYTVAAGIAIALGGEGKEWGWHLFAAAMVVVVFWAIANAGNNPCFRRVARLFGPPKGVANQ